MTDFPTIIASALAGDQDAYTSLYKAVLPLAKNRLYHRFTSLWEDSPELAYEAVHHLLIKLDKCPRTGYFLPWAKKVIMNFYLQELRDRSTIKHLLLKHATSIDSKDEDGDENWLQIEHPRNTHRQLEAHIDATYVLSRVRPRFRNAVVKRAMYGYDDLDKRSGVDAGTNGDLHELRQEIARGGYPQNSPDEAFTLPAILL